MSRLNEYSGTTMLSQKFKYPVYGNLSSKLWGKWGFLEGFFGEGGEDGLSAKG